MNQARRIVAAWLGRWVQLLHSCRECGGQVRPTDDICPTCGAAAPVKLPVAPALVISLSAASVLLVLAWLT